MQREVTRDWKHASEHVYAYTSATMTRLNPRQRQVLACSLVPLVDLMRANATMSVCIPPPPLMTLLSTPAMAAMAAGNETPPHPEQGGIRITEAYLLGILEAECIWRFRYFSQRSLDHV